MPTSAGGSATGDCSSCSGARASYPSRFTYSYGDGINLTRINDIAVPANTVDLTYTAANRLKSADGLWGAADYTYDATGNCRNHVVTATGAPVTTRVASYGLTDNRITGMTENGAALRTYTHDGNGNIMTDTRPGEAFSFTYNKRNRPASVTRVSVETMAIVEAMKAARRE